MKVIILYAILCGCVFVWMGSFPTYPIDTPILNAAFRTVGYGLWVGAICLAVVSRRGGI